MARKSRDMIASDDPRVAQIGHPAPPWLINYADLMTELVCFFIILYALEAALDKGANTASAAVKEKIESKEISGEVQTTKEGLKITLQEKEGVEGSSALFESGKAELTQTAKDMISAIAPDLAKLPNQIIVEGHTDSDPISTEKFSSNWELSTARAIGVVKYLVKELKLPPDRLAAIGYGEFKPIALNDTPENKKRNRRVVFLVKTMGIDKEVKSSDKEKKHGEAPKDEGKHE